MYIIVSRMQCILLRKLHNSGGFDQLMDMVFSMLECSKTSRMKSVCVCVCMCVCVSISDSTSLYMQLRF